MSKSSSKSKARGKPENLSPRIANRRATHEYHILEKLECGIALRGTEVKSVRNARVSLAEGYARIDPKTRELWLCDVDIATYPPAGPHQHEPKRQRKLLAHKRQIESMAGRLTSSGLTLVPLAMYFSRGMIKVELGLAQGKKQHDKRQDIKKQQADRDIRRGMTRKVL